MLQALVQSHGPRQVLQALAGGGIALSENKVHEENGKGHVTAGDDVTTGEKG